MRIKFLPIALFIVMVLSVNVGLASYVIYTDLDSKHPNYKAIEEITKENIASGYPDGSFQPEKEITRAEFIKIINKAFTEYNPKLAIPQDCFEDIKKDSWYTKHVCFSKLNGIVKGYHDGTFQPERTLQLAEALKILLAIYNENTDPDGQKWYIPVMEKAQQYNLVNESIDSAKREVTRGEIAELVVKAKNQPETKNFKKIELEETQIPESKILNVPFTSQAPHHEWIVPFDEACEEAVMIMLDHYLNGEAINKDLATEKILELIEWEEQRNYIIDIGTKEMSEILKNFYNLESQIYKDEEVTIEKLKELIADEKPIIIPIAGQKINNPNYTPPGPPYHVIVLTGYDQKNFYINDPGTQYGQNYKITHQLLFNAIHDWNGSKQTVETGQKAILVIK